ncbi:MAG: efflux RND transporter periplasmic adaptor subunit [Pirellulaceae bacterium]
MKRWMVFVAIVAFVAVAAGIYRSSTRGLPVQASQVQQDSIREFVDERGKTRLPKTHLITMPFPGRVEAIDLLEGQMVQQGEIVARVVEKDLEDAVDEARSAVERLAASIAKNDDISVESSTREQAELFVESMVSTVAAAEAREVTSEERRRYARKSLDRINELVRSGAETEEDQDRANLAYTESDVDFRQDGLVTKSLKSIQAATALMPRMVSEFIQRKSLARAVLEKEKQEAEARLRQALTRQERGAMRSDVTGVVLERAVSNEQFLAAGTVLLRIGQRERMEVEAELLSEDVVRVRQGDPVEIYGPAVGADVGEGVAGTVERIYPTGFTKIGSLGVEQQRVLVVVRFADGVLEKLHQEQDLGVDFRVRVRIFTDQKDAAMVVPRSALFRGADGGWEVFAVRGGRAELQPVEVGLMNDDFAEITHGVTTDEIVVLAPESSLSHGARVEPILRK